MTVACPDCKSVFRVDPAKVPATGVRARCSVCGGVIVISAGTLPVAVTPSSTATVSQPGGLASMSASSRRMGAVAQHPYTPQSPAAITPPSLSAAVMTPPMPAGVPALGIPTRQPTPSAPGNSQTRLADTQPSGVPAQRGMMSPPATTTLVGTPASGRANTLPVPARQPAAATPATGAAGTPATGRRPINPFLNADPGQRARRLARALVSDLVAYHPQKREEGLRSGTLRQVFREEIKKSYEEYVEQVGRELADSSPYFQDALNEILGGGRKLF